MRVSRPVPVHRHRIATIQLTCPVPVLRMSRMKSHPCSPLDRRAQPQPQPPGCWASKAAQNEPT